MKIKVVSLNLWNGGRLFDQAHDFLQRQRADLMFLQEAYNGNDLNIKKRFRTVEIFKATFPQHQTCFSPVFLDKREGEGSIQAGQLIISKFPLSNTRAIHIDTPFGEYDHDSIEDFSDFPTMLQTTFAKIGNKHVKLLNIHGPVNNDGTADTNRRLRMREVILEEIKDQKNVILSGDFNVQAKTQTIKGIEQKLINIFKDDLTTSFNVKQKNLEKFPGFANAVVDMMFISPEIKVINKSCPQVDISDHLPLVATLDV